jgi:hypothetical protein
VLLVDPELAEVTAEYRFLVGDDKLVYARRHRPPR